MQQVLLETGVGNQKNISNKVEEYSKEYCATIFGLHAYTECDTTNAFKSLGMVNHLKKLHHMPHFVPVFARL